MSGMWLDFWTPFFGALGGSLILVPALVWLSDRFLRQRLAKDLKKFETQLQRVTDLVGRRNEREFAITEGAWERMIRAVGRAQVELGAIRIVPTFCRMSEDEALRAIEHLQFEAHEQQQMREADGERRDELYARFQFAHGLRDAQKEAGEFKNWLSTRQIFLSEDIYGRFIEIRNVLHPVLTRASMYVGRDHEIPFEWRLKMEEALTGTLNAKIDDLAIVIRRRFGFDEAPVT